MIQVEFRWNIGDEVRIAATNAEARIDALRQDIQGQSYGVVYWDNSVRVNIWLYEWELKDK